MVPMTRLIVVFCMFALSPLLALSAAEECVEPKAPAALPSGATATREEMLAGQDAMKSYNAAVAAFSACVDRTHANPTRANELVRGLQTLANRFNAELRIFKQRNGG